MDAREAGRHALPIGRRLAGSRIASRRGCPVGTEHRRDGAEQQRRKGAACADQVGARPGIGGLAVPCAAPAIASCCRSAFAACARWPAPSAGTPVSAARARRAAPFLAGEAAAASRPARQQGRHLRRALLRGHLLRCAASAARGLYGPISRGARGGLAARREERGSGAAGCATDRARGGGCGRRNQAGHHAAERRSRDQEGDGPYRQAAQNAAGVIGGAGEASGGVTTHREGDGVGDRQPDRGADAQAGRPRRGKGEGASTMVPPMAAPRVLSAAATVPPASTAPSGSAVVARTTPVASVCML